MMTPSTPFTPFRPFAPFALQAPPRAAEATPVIAEALPQTIEPAPPPSPSMLRARAASGGDARAMAALLRELAPRIERVVKVVLGRSGEDAEDVVQQALIAFVRALPSFRGECEPVHFASRVAARTAIAAARRRRAIRAHYDDGVDLDHLDAPNDEPSPEGCAERKRRQHALHDALARIPPEQAETLALRIVLGWSLGEVAKATSVPLNTVRSRLRLAKAALRTAIDQDPITHEELTDD